MIKYNGIIKKSRTIDLAAVTGMVGAALAALPELRAVIPPEYYGGAFIVLSVYQAYLRVKTTGPMGQK